MARVCRLFLILVLSTIVLAACGKKDAPPIFEEAPILEVKEEVKSQPLTQSLTQSSVDLIVIEFVDPYDRIQRVPLKFTDHGLIKGTDRIMVPLTEQPDSALAMLGFDTTISIDGKSARLVRDEDYIDFDTESITCFVNDEAMAFMTDIPFYHNGTLYVPFEFILDAVGQPYEYEENKLIIKTGGTN